MLSSSVCLRRTHSQISQVIREYKKTCYRVPMSVLVGQYLPYLSCRWSYILSPNISIKNRPLKCKLKPCSSFLEVLARKFAIVTNLLKFVIFLICHVLSSIFKHDNLINNFLLARASYYQSLLFKLLQLKLIPTINDNFPLLFCFLIRLQGSITAPMHIYAGKRISMKNGSFY